MRLKLMALLGKFKDVEKVRKYLIQSLQLGE
jgi:hypothetical protein